MLQLITLLLKIHDLFSKYILPILLSTFWSGPWQSYWWRSLEKVPIIPWCCTLAFTSGVGDIRRRVTSLCSTSWFVSHKMLLQHLNVRKFMLVDACGMVSLPKKKRFFEFVDRFFRCWLHLLLGHINWYTLALWGLPFMDVLIVFLGSCSSIAFVLPFERTIFVCYHKKSIRMNHLEMMNMLNEKYKNND